MGCFSSKEAVYEAKHGQAAKTGREQGSASGPNPPAYLLEAGPQSILLGANAGILTPSSVTNQNKYAIPNSGPRNAAGQGPTGSFIALGAGGGSITGINRRTPVGLKSGAHVSADLNAIVDDQGTINALVSRQLSVMSHYSVKSEAGSVILQPEVAHGPNALGFTLHKLIGRGGFGNVYLGEWEGRKVAVKVVTGNNNETASDQPEDKEWEARKEKMAQMEAILMASVNHPNIVHTLKVIAHQGDAMDPELAAIERELFTEKEDQHPPSFEWHIIMEYCDRGSLSRALAAMRFHEFVETQGYVRWDAWACLQTLKEVTKALMFLHENRILHGDLKAANVLLSSSETDRRGFVAKVSDFGLSRVLAGNRKEIKTQTFGTVTHMPPELLSKGILSPSADVYAMGVLLWEAYSGDRVFKQLSDSEVILAVVTRKARPQFPPDTPHRLKYLAERCWAELAEVRPSLQQLYNELENLQLQLCPQGADSPRLLVQSCIKQKRPVAQVPQVQMGAKAPGQQSRLAQGMSTDGSAKGGAAGAAATKTGPLPTQGREYNSGGGHYVGSPLGGGSGMGSHGPSQADKLKTFAAINRTQQNAKKSSEYGMGPASGGMNGSGGSVTQQRSQAAAGPSGPRPLMKVPSLQKAREPELSVSHSAASSPNLISPYKGAVSPQSPTGAPASHATGTAAAGYPPAAANRAVGSATAGGYSSPPQAGSSTGSLPALQVNGSASGPTPGAPASPQSPTGAAADNSLPVVPSDFLGRARTASATGISRPSRFGNEDSGRVAGRQASTGNVGGNAVGSP
ncbi:hypothetical protein CHLRE_16g649100v5 [Chlamydomonas reinhardtii]|uniref:Protein kinase domain-containing protein n=1 Tax=Chlamydomonas reinhardtii TaxID=3055 RepID=A0A2K3CSP4_CHLRE|nr:uncharacterized protein CHLRE_16g649100v5 [Chlamydomonas reinhardtii]PNW71316.1 hypothetical protein CHLRE_16g649100v5 [Chlamydomonas reinhardtii]